MYVVKRNGSNEAVQFDKITTRISALCADLALDPVGIAQHVVTGLCTGISTSELDTLAAETAAARASTHPDYETLAARLTITNLYKNTPNSFSAAIAAMRANVHPDTGAPMPLISATVANVVKKHKTVLDSAAACDALDEPYDFFGLRTLERSYLLRSNNTICERPRQMLMRVALGIWGDDIDNVLQCFRMLSDRLYTHATPTLFNAGSPTQQQLSSCYLLTVSRDSIRGIFKTLSDCAAISKGAGGIGLCVSDIRARGSHIHGTGGRSNGIVPMLRVFNNTARYVDQGGGKRKGSFAMYIEPWHADIRDFLELKKNHGHEQDRARDLFYALWIPDLFMRRVRDNAQWTLMCPSQASGLTTCYGEKFDALYTKYEGMGVGTQISAVQLWKQIVTSQIETGTPYMLFKDACNVKSNQKNLGTIKCSNLCTEIVQFTSPAETSVCNLASINLVKFVTAHNTIDYEALIDTARHVTRHLNRVIDVNEYPVSEAETSNKMHRPIGIGVQGLADVFCVLHLPFDSNEARTINKHIFESIYYGAVSQSADLAQEFGPYKSFVGSPASQGQLQWHLWGIDKNKLLFTKKWEELLAKITLYGLRNSLLVALMPTASTSQILGNNECFEPYTSNIFTRRTLSGEFTVINKHLVKVLQSRGLWDEHVRNELIQHEGSVQNIECIPEDVKQVYRTVWEIPGKHLLEMAADRGPFVCQSQSQNAFMSHPTTNKVSSMLFYAWKLGLKTGMYYLRTRAKTGAIKFSVSRKENDNTETPCISCSA